MLQCGLPNDSKYGYYWSGISYVPDAPVDAQTMNTGKIIGQRDKTTKVNWAFIFRIKPGFKLKCNKTIA